MPEPLPPEAPIIISRESKPNGDEVITITIRKGVIVKEYLPKLMDGLSTVVPPKKKNKYKKRGPKPDTETNPFPFGKNAEEKKVVARSGGIDA